MGKRNWLFGNQNRRGKQPKAARHRRVSLHIEQLEQRILMNVDNNPAPLADIDVVAIDNGIRALPVLTAPIWPTFTPIISDDVGPWRPYTPQKPLPEIPEEGFESVEELRGWVIDAIDAQYGNLLTPSTAISSERAVATRSPFGPIFHSTETLPFHKFLLLPC